MSAVIRKPDAHGEGGLSVTRLADGRVMLAITTGPLDQAMVRHLVLSTGEVVDLVAAITGGKHAR